MSFNQNLKYCSHIPGIYAPNYPQVWKLARQLGLPIASHVVPSMADTFAKLAGGGLLGRDTLLIHMTGIDDASWKITADSGVGVSLSVPIEMTMRHGTPAIMKSLSLGIQPSLSSDVECTMTADFFTQMRSAFTMQRLIVNEAAMKGEPRPALITARDVIRFATLRGAQALWLGDKVGSLSPGKEADIIVLDATALNVAPLIQMEAGPSFTLTVKGINFTTKSTVYWGERPIPARLVSATELQAIIDPSLIARAGMFPVQVRNPGPSLSQPKWGSTSNRAYFIVIVAGRGSFIEAYPLFGLNLQDYDALFAEKLDLLLQIRDNEFVTPSPY